jgi:hypothetical protein
VFINTSKVCDNSAIIALAWVVMWQAERDPDMPAHRSLLAHNSNGLMQMAGQLTRGMAEKDRSGCKQLKG